MAQALTAMKLATAFLALALLPAGLPASAPPRTYGLQKLGDNGRGFVTRDAKLPLHCYDAPGLLALPVEEQAEALNKAAAAGFNAISFEAPLAGPLGLSKTLGKIDAAQGDNLTRLIQACAKRRLYAFPVLWTPATADALIGTANAKTVFFGGKNSLGWQHWLAGEMARLKVEGVPLTQTATVGGWILYRGPWPGGPPLPHGEANAVTPSPEAWLRQWAQWQVRDYHKLGFTQRLGLGLWAKADLPLTLENRPEAPVIKADGDKPAAPVIEAAPFAPLSTTETSGALSLEQAKELDQLPPVPGPGGAKADDGEGDESPSLSVPAPPATPWDLEGLDWDKVEAFFATAPLSTQVDFLEFSLETEDWYRVGDRLAQAAAKAEVPVVWRQDWRTASRYERPKRLEAPLPLAGLVGPWPEEDWPGEGETLWPFDKDEPQTPFEVRKVAIHKVGRKVVLEVELNKPADLVVRWGKGWPLDQETRSEGRSKAEFKLPLVGAQPGEWLLLQVKADTRSAGGAVARARWIRVPQ